MARSSGPRKRQRGSIDVLPSGALRVRVFAGRDPLTKGRHSLTEIVPAGPKAAAEAEKVRARLLNKVDERRNPKTSATLNQLLDKHLELIDVAGHDAPDVPRICRRPRAAPHRKYQGRGA